MAATTPTTRIVRFNWAPPPRLGAPPARFNPYSPRRAVFAPLDGRNSAQVACPDFPRGPLYQLPLKLWGVFCPKSAVLRLAGARRAAVRRACALARAKG